MEECINTLPTRSLRYSPSSRPMLQVSWLCCAIAFIKVCDKQLLNMMDVLFCRPRNRGNIGCCRSTWQSPTQNEEYCQDVCPPKLPHPPSMSLCPGNWPRHQPLPIMTERLFYITIISDIQFPYLCGTSVLIFLFTEQMFSYQAFIEV